MAPPGYEIGRKGVQLLMEQIENKPAAKTKHVRIGSAARTVTAVTATEDINRQEIVRPFLLERVSTRSISPDATAAPAAPATDINLGAYLVAKTTTRGTVPLVVVFAIRCSSADAGCASAGRASRSRCIPSRARK